MTARLATQAVQDPRERLARGGRVAAHSIALNFLFPPKKEKKRPHGPWQRKTAWALAVSPATFLTRSVLHPPHSLPLSLDHPVATTLECTEMSEGTRDGKTQAILPLQDPRE